MSISESDDTKGDMSELRDAFRRRTLWLVCEDELQKEGTVAGRSNVPIRPSPRVRYERLSKVLPFGEDVGLGWGRQLWLLG